MRQFVHACFYWIQQKDFVKQFLVNQFGETNAKQQIQLLQKILQQDIPLHDVCNQIKHFMPHSQRLQLIHYLFGIAKADGHVADSEKDIISTNEVKFLGNNIKFSEINLTKKSYYFGIRPEHFSLSENCQYKFKPNINLTENLGNEKIAYIKIDGNEISAKIPSQKNIIDQIGFDMKDIFVFDETGTRVRS